MDVKISHRAIRPTIAHRTIEPLGRPGSPPPPPVPPKRNLRRRSSSIEATFGAPPSEGRRLRDGSPHGPLLCPSSDGGSEPPPPPEPPLLGPQGPFVSANSPRTRLPHPKIIFISAEYRGERGEKQWQAAARLLCRGHGRRSGQSSARRARALAQAQRWRCDHHRGCHRTRR